MASDPRAAAPDLEDIRAGLSARPLSIPCKYFYDDRGSDLFDQICDLPEYYPTRTEASLLVDVAPTIADITRPHDLLELGSGTARKTRTLLRALLERRAGLRYVPVDISEFALAAAAESLREEFSGLEVSGIACDYTATLEALPNESHCLAIFLGSTIGNFPPDAAIGWLTELRSHLDASSWFLLGVDLVKPVAVLEAAYNDSLGVTAAFNRNILDVVNRLADGNFDAGQFDHLAFFDRDRSQIEMHLVARRRLEVRLAALDLALVIEPGETIRTEISRKFTRESTEEMLRAAGFRFSDWYPSRDDAFALALARVGAGR